MLRLYDSISLGHLDVEFFRKELDKPLSICEELIGPFPGGPSGIFVCAMSALGAKTGIIATVGEDAFGKCIVERLKKYKVDISHIIYLKNITTGTAFTSYNSDGSRNFIFHLENAAPGKFSPKHINKKYIQSSRWLHISGNVLALSKSARDAIYKAVDIAYKNNIPISFDPNLRLEVFKSSEIKEIVWPVLKKTTVFLPSIGEIKYIMEINNEENGISQLFKEGIKIIARKEGKNGSTIFTKEKKIYVKPFRINEVDPTGCGDSYCAGFIYGYIKNWQLEKIGEFANAVGAITATKRGTTESLPSLEDVKLFIKSKN